MPKYEFTPNGNGSRLNPRKYAQKDYDGRENSPNYVKEILLISIIFLMAIGLYRNPNTTKNRKIKIIKTTVETT